MKTFVAGWISVSLWVIIITLTAGVTPGCRTPKAPSPQPRSSQADRLTQTGRRQFEAGAVERAMRTYRQALEAARTADERDALSLAAAHLAIALGADGQWTEALGYARLAKAETVEATAEYWMAVLIEARIALALEDLAGAGELAETVWLAPESVRRPAVRAEAGVLMADIYLAQDRMDAARDYLATTRGLMPDDASFALRAMWQGAAGRIAMRDDQPLDAAVAFDRQAAHWRDAGRYQAMAAALEAAGDAWLAADRRREAADRYVRAGRSLDAIRPDDARRLLDTARDLAETLGDDELLRRISVSPERR